MRTRPTNVRALYSLRMRLMLLVALVLAPALALIIVSAAEFRREAARDVSQSAYRLAERAADDAEQIIEECRTLLSVLSLVPEVRTMEPVASQALFRRILPEHDNVRNLGIARLDGRVIASAVPMARPLSVADRPYFRGVLRTGEFSIGEYQVGRITGDAAVNFGFPLRDDKGQLRGVLYAALDLAWLNTVAGTAELPAESTFIVTDRNGVVLVHYPASANRLGSTLPDGPLKEALRSGRGGTVEAEDPDGIERLYTFHPIRAARQGIAGYAAIGISREAAFAHARFRNLRDILAMLVAAVLTLLVVSIGADWFFLRQARALMRAAQRVSGGDLNARTGISHSRDEMGRLASAFDDMTGSLQQARADLLQAEDDKKRIYREVIRCVTQDRFHLVEPAEIPVEGRLILDLPLESPDDYRNLRARLRETAAGSGMDDLRVRELVQAVGEAATNAVKHATDGRCRVWALPDRLVARISDAGAGIRPEDMAATILLPGFSTKVSLGMGYSLMLEMADRVWMSTGPEGTIVQLEKRFQGQDPMLKLVNAALDRFKTDEPPA